jgi:hypothetical protein
MVTIQNVVQKSFEYLVQVANIPTEEQELFKICVDYFHHLSY